MRVADAKTELNRLQNLAGSLHEQRAEAEKNMGELLDSNISEQAEPDPKKYNGLRVSLEYIQALEVRLASKIKEATLVVWRSELADMETALIEASAIYFSSKSHREDAENEVIALRRRSAKSGSTEASIREHAKIKLDYEQAKLENQLAGDNLRKLRDKLDARKREFNEVAVDLGASPVSVKYEWTGTHSTRLVSA